MFWAQTSKFKNTFARTPCMRHVYGCLRATPPEFNSQLSELIILLDDGTSHNNNIRVRENAHPPERLSSTVSVITPVLDVSNNNYLYSSPRNRTENELTFGNQHFERVHVTRCWSIETYCSRKFAKNKNWNDIRHLINDLKEKKPNFLVLNTVTSPVLQMSHLLIFNSENRTVFEKKTRLIKKITLQFARTPKIKKIYFW